MCALLFHYYFINNTLELALYSRLSDVTYSMPFKESDREFWTILRTSWTPLHTQLLRLILSWVCSALTVYFNQLNHQTFLQWTSHFFGLLCRNSVVFPSKNLEGLRSMVMRMICTFDKGWYERVFKTWVNRHEKCEQCNGRYFENESNWEPC